MDAAARLCAGPWPRLERPHQQVCDTSTVCFYALQENLLSEHMTAKIKKKPNVRVSVLSEDEVSALLGYIQVLLALQSYWRILLQ